MALFTRSNPNRPLPIKILLTVLSFIFIEAIAGTALLAVYITAVNGNWNGSPLQLIISVLIVIGSLALFFSVIRGDWAKTPAADPQLSTQERN
jgi:cell division protein FtsW (lipid II flippase)